MRWTINVFKKKNHNNIGTFLASGSYDATSLNKTRHVIAVYLSNLSIDEMKQIIDGKMAAANPLHGV